MGDEFYQMLFLFLLRRSCGVFLFWCVIVHWLIYTCWTILVTLGWIQVIHGIWYPLCIVGFGLLVFCWEFFYLYSSMLLLLRHFSHVPIVVSLCDPIDGSPPGSPVPGIFFGSDVSCGGAFMIAQLVSLLAMQETLVRFLAQEDTLEKG